MDGFIDATREAIEAFLALDIADETLIALGAFLVVIGALKIIKSSLTLIVWVALAALGVGSISYGMNHSRIDLPFLREHGGEWIERVGATAGASAEALARACRELRGN